jgi:hypothetical protein
MGSIADSTFKGEKVSMNIRWSGLALLLIVDIADTHNFQDNGQVERRSR